MEIGMLDRFVRSLAARSSRRRLVAGLLGGAIGTAAVSQICAAQSPASGPSTPGATPVAGVSGNVFRSARFGYHLTWPASWRVEASGTIPNGDHLSLSNDISEVTFSGIATNADPAQTIANAKATYVGSHHIATVVTAATTPVPANVHDRATASFTYQASNSSATAETYVATFDCLTLEPGASVLLIFHGVARDAAASQQAPFAALLDRLVIPLYGVKTYTGLSHQHTLGRVKYPQVPPVGGPHNPIWQDCGFYNKPVANEHAVHSMEHGAIWITFLPNLPADQLAIIRQLAQTIPYVLASPYPGLPSPVVASAWGAQVHLEDADEIRLRSFIATYQYGPDTEHGAPCSGGTDSTSF